MIGYSTITLVAAIEKSAELFMRVAEASDTLDTKIGMCYLAEADYFEHVAIAKQLCIAEDTPSIRKSNEWYGKFVRHMDGNQTADEQYDPFILLFLANSYLNMAIYEHILGNPMPQNPLNG